MIIHAVEAKTYQVRARIDAWAQGILLLTFAVIVLAGLGVGEYVKVIAPGLTFVLTVWGVYRLRTAKVVVWPESVAVRNLLWTHHIPWDEVAAFSRGTVYIYGRDFPNTAMVELRNGRTIPIFATSVPRFRAERDDAAVDRAMAGLNADLDRYGDRS